jgi:hypothetical protein
MGQLKQAKEMPRLASDGETYVRYLIFSQQTTTKKAAGLLADEAAEHGVSLPLAYSLFLKAPSSNTYYVWY